MKWTARLNPSLLLAAVLAPIVSPWMLAIQAAEPAPAIGNDGSPKFEPAAIEFFEAKVRPLLVKRCYECHGAEIKEPKGGLRMTSRESILRGGETSPAAVPGKPKESLLVESINYTGLYEMPPKTRLPAEEVAVLTKWVEMGLPWPAQAAASVAHKSFDLEGRKKAHWAWNPIPYEVPTVKSAAVLHSDIDRFLVAKLEEKRLGIASPASRETLLRRATFDITGLPPTAAELDDFLADPSPNAFEKVVDRLLKSPRYGERWARHWLDLVRYAESRGHEFDYNVPNAWQYRDYVVRALNADVPYDTFALEHLAGDVLPNPRLNPEKKFNESILGTGFYFLGEWIHSPVDIRQDECDRQDNMIDVMSKTFLGLTISCARCHDHKFDAISQADYYALAGYMQSSAYRLARFETMEDHKSIAAKLNDLRTQMSGSIIIAQQEALQKSLQGAEGYLLASREAIHQGISAGEKEPTANRIATIAKERELDQARLANWVKAIVAAKIDPTDPLHLWGLLCADPAITDGKALLAWSLPLAKKWKEEAEASEKALAALDKVVDYANLRPGEWLQDGFSFGPGPQEVGKIRISGGAEAPILEIAEVAAARRDPFWNGLQLAAGAEHDWAATSNVIRAGRTIRTPSFIVKDGPVWVLATGEGHSTAVVCSHQMTAGPLHGGLSQKFRHDKGTWRWMRQDLSRYIGQRVHLEFSLEKDEDLAIRMVVQAKNSPPEPAPLRYKHLATLLSGGNGPLPIDNAAALAAGIRLLFPQMPSRVRHSSWLIDANSAEGKKLAAVVREYREKEDLLRKEVQPASRLAMSMWDGDAVDEHLLIRGNSRTPGAAVPARLPQAIFGADQPRGKTGSGRLEMAGKLTDPKQNPFFARVQVNRIWHHLFGRGIVASTDNFGVLGERPTHPELLQYLADQFVREGFSQKQLIKSLMMSTAYQMSSVADPKAMEVDPKNELLHHMRIRRLESEAIRDSLLAISGRLEEKGGGPPTPVYLTEFMQGRGRPGGGPLDGAGRRSLYISVRRNFLSPMMLAFDTPIPFTTVGKRNLSNVPAQALILMNDPFVIDQAKRWGAQLAGQKLPPEERVRSMYRTAFARLPTAAESAAAVEFLALQGKEYGMPPEQMLTDPRPWSDLGHVLINSKEFIFIP